MMTSAPFINRFSVLSASCCFLLAMLSASAAQRTWDGGATDWDWRSALNWDGSIFLPNPIDPGDTLVFPAGPTKLINTNDFGAGTNFNSLIYSGSGYTSHGNRIGLSNGVSVTHASGSTIIYLPITLRDDQNFTVSSASSTLILNGDIDIGANILTFDGAGNSVTIGEILDSRLSFRASVRKNGTGRLTIFQPSDHEAPTIVNGGTLAVESRMTNSTVTVNNGGTLRGSGRIGGLNLNSGGTLEPGGTTPDTLDCYDDVNLAAGSILRLKLNGTSPGVSYDQLDVRGTVTVGGTLQVVPGFVPAVGDTFTIIENDGTDGIVGSFDGLPQNAVFTVNGRNYRIHYGRGLTIFDGNDVTLEALPATSIWDGGGGLNKFWSQPLNWVGDVAPLGGDNVQFTSIGPLLRTENDFSAAHPIGTIILISGDHRIEGSLPQLNGGIQVIPGVNDTNRVPRRIEVAAPIVLGANQTFEVNYTNSFLSFEGLIDLGTHNLTVFSESRFSLGSTEHSQINILGGISGAGTLIKNGPGNLSLLSPSTCAQTIVNTGTFRSSAFYDSPMSGSVTVNSGATLEVEDDVAGDITVNGGLLRGIFARIGGNVEINGGTFNAWDLGLSGVGGNLRMLNGALYDTEIRFASTNNPLQNGVDASGTVELAGCTLNVRVAETFSPGSMASVVSAHAGRTGTFTGLPQGTRFVVNGQDFMIDYRPNQVVLIANLPYVWSGASAGNLWTTAANWVGGFAPTPNADLVFPSGVTKLAAINDFPNGSRFQSLTFRGPSYVLAGNSFQLTGAINNEFATGDTTINLDLFTTASLFECLVANSSRLFLQGSVTGTGTLKKTGTGTLRLSGSVANTQGRVEVWGGEVELDKDTGINAIAAFLQIGDETNDIRVTLLGDNQIADGADVTVRSRARFDLNGHSDTIGRLLGDGTVSLSERFPGRPSRLTVSGGGSFPGVIMGEGGLTKIGSSTLTLSGENSYSSLTMLDQGTLAVQGALANSTVHLDGGTLTGRGRVHSVTANAGGTIVPGSLGPDFQNALHSGNIALNSAVSFRPTLFTIDPGYESSYMQITGTANLGNAALVLNVSFNFVPPTNKTFVIIENDGADAIAGTFAGLPEGGIFGARGFAFRISYVGGTGNDVAVTRVPAPPADFSSIELLGNGRFLMQGEGLNGLEYNIQAASNLNPIINWIQVGRSTGNSSGIFQFIHSNSPAIPMRFYRAMTP